MQAIRIEHSDGKGLWRANSDNIHSCIIDQAKCHDSLYFRHKNFPSPATDGELRVKSSIRNSDKNSLDYGKLISILPRPSNDFIKKYCEVNGSIKEILVEYEKIGYTSEKTGMKFCLDSELPLNPNDIFISTYSLKVAKDNTITIKPIKDSWNREEVIELFNRFYATDMVYEKLEKNDFDKWLKENL